MNENIGQKYWSPYLYYVKIDLVWPRKGLKSCIILSIYFITYIHGIDGFPFWDAMVVKQIWKLFDLRQVSFMD